MLRFGTVPILWNNDDLPDLRGGFVIPHREVLDAIKKTGFAGTELGSNYPRDAATLRQELKSRSLTLSGAYYCPGLTDAAKAEAALDEVEPFLELLETVGCEFLIAAEPLEPRRAAAAGRAAAPDVPRLGAEGWSSLAQALDELGWRCKGRGIRLAFHNHAGTWVETPDEVARLLDVTDPERVGLCLDTGHWTVGGGDAAEAVQRHWPRLKYLHLKDVDPEVLAALRTERFGFLEALRRRVFTELGKGCVDVAGIALALRNSGWSGWVV
ncbi:MAG: TIM barrel protein, partial [Candidatus Sericytochromatia bacterium]|nr:TIM barrel protein [Candidatus Tanganyikabacteria bacterium]